MIVGDNTIAAEGLQDFFRTLGKKGFSVAKRMAKKFLKKPGRALETGAVVGSAIGSPSLKAALSSLPDVINFYHRGKGLNLGKFV